MTECTVTIVNPLGLHARPAAQVVKLAARFQSDIELGRDGTMANAKSIMGVMMLAAEQGALVVIRADGSDEAEAIAALVALVEGGFGE